MNVRCRIVANHDIFERRVCRALELTEGMKSRARIHKTYANLDVYLMSPEDVFLFKGITEREVDLDDMHILAEVGIRWKTVEHECLAQTRSGHSAYLLRTKLMELKDKFGINSLIIKTLLDHAYFDMLTVVFGNIFSQGNLTFAEIAGTIKQKYSYSTSWTRKQLSFLIQKGIIGKNETAPKRYLYYVKRPLRSSQ
jgi:hypothetical protein